MKKLLSLIKACMTDNMNLFVIGKKKSKEDAKRARRGMMLPIVLFLIIFFYMWGYANMMMEPLQETHLEYTVLMLFVAFTTIMTLVEGIYKSSSLLFNCKDDDMLLSLPISRSTVLFIRVLKFYVFELMYNSMFLAPAMIAYVRYVPVDWTYILSSVLAIILLPIIPIVISCIFGGIISLTSSKFKQKNIAQIIITMAILLVVLYGSFNLQNFIDNINSYAGNINETITKVYYPAKLYASLVTNFNIKDLLVFTLSQIAIFAVTVLALGKVYFKINSMAKSVKVKHSTNKDYKVKTNTPVKSLIKKELNRFINSPVFVTNAAFGLVIFIAGCILASIKFETFASAFATAETGLTLDVITEYIPLVLFGFICFSSLMSSITSSMISLEGKSFNILKSLPVKPFTIIMSKVLTAILIIIPALLIGDIVVFIRFKFGIIEILLTLLASVLMPFVAETIGIIANLKHPKMDADNDTEVVKQSTSSMIAVLGGMLLSMVTLGVIGWGASTGASSNTIILVGLGIYAVIFAILVLDLSRNGTKYFNKIN